MASTDFHLVTDWVLDASVDDVWQVLIKPETWPQWWPSVKKVEVLQDGDADGIDAVRRLTWTTALPYELTFDMQTVRVEPKTVIEGKATGELDGIGRWTLTPDGSKCKLRYDQALDGGAVVCDQAGIRVESWRGDGTRPARAGGLSVSEGVRTVKFRPCRDISSPGSLRARDASLRGRFRTA